MSIIDKRTERSTKSADNRKKFMDRYKDAIKDKVDRIGNDSGFSDIKDKDKYDITIRDTDEYQFEKDYEGIDQDIVVTGNEQYNKGDKIPVEKGKGEPRGGNNKTENNNEVQFTLTKEEFINIYFQDMALPNFIKDSMEKSVEYKVKRAGYEKQGTPSRIDLKKTFEMAEMRKICDESEDPPFLDDIDLRYKRLEKVPVPIKHAVMFLCLDVSGSMSQRLRQIAKKFFMLLYIFLTSEYEVVDVRFIIHAEEAFEVDEKGFFYETFSGGTIMSTALNLVQKIIDTEYKGKSVNLYISQATDGDNFDSDEENYMTALDNLLPQIQYYTYLETSSSIHDFERNWKMFHKLKLLDNMKLAMAQICEEEDVLSILKQMFRKSN